MSGKTVLLMVAAVIAAFTAISVRNRLAQAPAPADVAVVATNHVVIAKRELAPGAFVQAQDLDWGDAPATPAEPLLQEGAVHLPDFNGAVVRRPIRVGEPVPASALMKAGEGGFMSAVLEPGMRAVSIAVNATSGNAGFISPGDRIDLIVTHRIKLRGGENNSEESVVSETFVRDVRVVAVDQQLDNPENKAILAKTVTVEVTPRQVEQVSVAAEMGKISMALRSIAAPVKAGDKNAQVLTDLYGQPQGEGKVYTRDSDVSTLMERGDASVPRVRVIRGDQSENLDFFQGVK